MKSLFAIIPSLLAFAISTNAQLVGITITSPTDGYNLPLGSVGSAPLAIAYTVAPDVNVNSLSILFNNVDTLQNPPITVGKQITSYGLPSVPPGTYPMTFVEKYTLNQTILTVSQTMDLIVPAPFSSTPPPPPPPSSAPVTSAQPSSSAPPVSSSSSFSSTLFSSSSSIISSSSSRLSLLSSSSLVPNTTTSLTTVRPKPSTSVSFTASASSNSTAAPAPSATSQNTPLIIASVCGFVAVLAAGFGYAFLSKTRKNRRKDRVFGDDDPVGLPPQVPFDRAVGGVVGAPSAEERPDSWEPEVKHAPGALYTTTTAPPPVAYYNQQPQGYGDYSQQQYAAGYYQQPQAYPQNPDIQLQNAHNWTGQYPQQNYHGQGDYGYR